MVVGLIGIVASVAGVVHPMVSPREYDPDAQYI